MTSFGSTFIGPDGYEYSSTGPRRAAGPRFYGGGGFGNVQSMLAQMQNTAMANARRGNAMQATKEAVRGVNMGLGGFGNPLKTAAIDRRRRAMAVNTSNYNRYKKEQEALKDLQQRFRGNAAVARQGAGRQAPAGGTSNGPAPSEGAEFTVPGNAPPPSGRGGFTVPGQAPPGSNGSSSRQMPPTAPPSDEPEIVPATTVANDPEGPATTPPPRTPAPASTSTPAAPAPTNETSSSGLAKPMVATGEPSEDYMRSLANSWFGRMIGTASDAGVLGSDPGDRVRADAAYEAEVAGQVGDKYRAYRAAHEAQEGRRREWLENASLEEAKRFLRDPDYHAQVLDSIGYQPNLAQRMLGGDLDTDPSAGEKLLGVVPDAMKENPLDITMYYPGPFGTRTSPRGIYNDAREELGFGRTDVQTDSGVGAANDAYEQSLNDAIEEGYTSNHPAAQLASLEARIVKARRGLQETQSELNTSRVLSGGPLDPLQQFFGGIGEYFGARPVMSPDDALTLRDTIRSYYDQIGALESQRDLLRRQFGQVDPEIEPIIPTTEAVEANEQRLRDLYAEGQLRKQREILARSGPPSISGGAYTYDPVYLPTTGEYVQMEPRSLELATDPLMASPDIGETVRQEAAAREARRVQDAENELSAYRYMLEQFPPQSLDSSPNYLYTADPVYNPATGESIRRAPIDRYKQAIDPFLAAPDYSMAIERDRQADAFFNEYADRMETQVGAQQIENAIRAEQGFSPVAHMAGPYRPAPPPQGAAHGLGRFGRPLRPSERTFYEFGPGSIYPELVGGRIPNTFVPGYHTPGLPVGVPASPPRVPAGYTPRNPLADLLAFPPFERPIIRGVN